jgi:serine/threonine-protein kinase RsbW
MRTSRYRAAFTSDTIKNIGVARRGIAGFASDCGFPPEAVDDIKLAAGEALSNAFEHGSMHETRRITVDCSFDGRALTIEVQDQGLGFPLPLDLPAVVPDARGRGFGIFLMRRLMDEVSFDRNGTRVRLVRRLS